MLAARPHHQHHHSTLQSRSKPGFSEGQNSESHSNVHLGMKYTNNYHFLLISYISKKTIRKSLKSMHLLKGSRFYSYITQVGKGYLNAHKNISFNLTIVLKPKTSSTVKSMLFLLCLHVCERENVSTTIPIFVN